MRHFTTKDGDTLGTLFLGDKGRTLMQTKSEEALMWDLDEDTICLEDECMQWTLRDLIDLFLKESSRCTKEELLRRGWDESRWTEGLGMRLAITKDGRTCIIR